MHRLFPTLYTLPLYAALLSIAASIYLLFTPAVPAAYTAALLGLAAVLLLIFRFRFSRLEQLVHTYTRPTDEPRNLSFSAQLEQMLHESSATKRREVSTALADTQAEIDALQSQINPHFLYNTLDAIRGQALIDDSPVIADMTEALSILFRYSISRTGNLVTLREEFRCIEKYLMIQQFRFSGKFQYVRDVDPNLLSCLIPRLTLQPIVENAIYHGLETRPEGGIITLSLEQSGGYLVIRVSDNGIGMTESQLLAINEKLRVSTLVSVPLSSKKGSGIALGNVNRRIRLTFGDEYGLSVSSAPNIGTDVEILLPITHATPEQEEPRHER